MSDRTKATGIWAMSDGIDELHGMPLAEAASRGGDRLAEALRIAMVVDGVLPAASSPVDLGGSTAHRARTLREGEFAKAASRAAHAAERGEPAVAIAKAVLADVYVQRMSADIIWGDFDKSKGDPAADFRNLTSQSSSSAVDIARTIPQLVDLDRLSEGRFEAVEDSRVREALARELAEARSNVRNPVLEHRLHDIATAVVPRSSGLIAQAASLPPPSKPSISRGREAPDASMPPLAVLRGAGR